MPGRAITSRAGPQGEWLELSSCVHTTERQWKTNKLDAGLLDAISFAAARHRNQRRKDFEVSPYINYPIALAHLLSTTEGVDDLVFRQAAILHDTIGIRRTRKQSVMRGSVVKLVSLFWRWLTTGISRSNVERSGRSSSHSVYATAQR
jgi:(p)ppGpp synthase/HD superfamily hydrolase